MVLSGKLAVCCALAFVLGAAAYAGGFQLNEAGARAMAQAGAFAARASDGSAIYFNPAGLGFQDLPSAYVGVTTIIPTSTFYGPLQDNSNAKTKAPWQMFTPINAYVTYPLSGRLHVGFGVNNPFGLGSKWPDDWVGARLTTNVQLQTFFFTPTVAYLVTDDLSVGAGFNYARGTVKLERAVETPVGTPRASIDMNGDGAGFNLGALYKISPKLSAGVSYRSKVKVNATGTASFTPSYSFLPAGDASLPITLPPTAFVGVAYAPMDNLSVEADYQFIGWSTYNQLAIEFAKDGSSSVTPKNYKDTYILRIGGEYTMDYCHFRAGYLYDHSPVSSAYVDPILPDANRNGFNVGLGYDITPSISVDVAYFFLKFDQRQAVNTIPETDFDGTYNTYANLFALNVGYTFR